MTTDDDVRRLLAALDAHDRLDPPPLPEDVAARLDARLSGLGREHAREPAAAPVVPLRRRVRPSLAAAAAVVLVAGGGAFVAGGLLSGGSGTEASSEAAGSAANAPTTSSEISPDRPVSPESVDEDAAAADSLRTLRGPRELQRADLAGQVRRLVAQGTLRLDPDAAGQRGQSARVRRAGCTPPDAVGAQLGVRYDAEPATLVVAGADSGARAVRVYSCSGDQVLDRTQVPAELAPR